MSVCMVLRHDGMFSCNWCSMAGLPRSQPAQRVASSGPGWDSQGSSQYRLDHSLRQAANSGQSDILEQQQVCDQWGHKYKEN